MFINKEELKNKIVYRASYRGSKEMDILMISFVSSLINKLNLEQLQHLNKFVNMDDESLMSIKNEESIINFDDPSLIEIVKNFKKFKI
ncbi:succinate dehydrogenase assembly factor 2 [Candidatus Pelagibacter sp.]|nr:succinate dehydrogenase assembly factor 2 [Candidatus Pelagibacter sp.]|tara:strand:- start:44 stop:307 length:264 start_codon:yes stop_codon:yes gene_type:complete